MNTPRTDANCGWPWGHHGRIECGDLKWSPDGPFVHSEVARAIERENAALRAAIAESEEFARKNGETLAAKVKELLDENAALRKLLAEPYQFFRFGHKAMTPWGKALDGWCERAENLGVGKEAQP